jgi:hypothetical protein
MRPILGLEKLGDDKHFYKIQTVVISQHAGYQSQNQLVHQAGSAIPDEVIGTIYQPTSNLLSSGPIH